MVPTHQIKIVIDRRTVIVWLTYNYYYYTTTTIVPHEVNFYLNFVPATTFYLFLKKKKKSSKKKKKKDIEHQTHKVSPRAAVKKNNTATPALIVYDLDFCSTT